MANTVYPRKVQYNPVGIRSECTFVWDADATLTAAYNGISSGDTIVPAMIAGYTDKTVYFLKGSAFGGAVSLTLSPDPSKPAASFLTAHDVAISPISGKTADYLGQVLENGLWAAPTAAATTTNVMVWLVCMSTR